jgi:hypothetical protein
MTVDNFRRNIVAELKDFFEKKGEDVGYINSNEVNFPCLIGEDEKWVVVRVIIPKGTKTEEYDGYAMREQYSIKVAETEEKKRKSAEAKAKKIAKDKKKREEKGE